MLMTDVGEEMCWRQLKDYGDGFGHLVTNNVGPTSTIFLHKRRTPTSKFSHQQHDVTNITMSPTSHMKTLNLNEKLRD